MSRNTTIVISVIALHVAVLWAMQVGLLRRVTEAVVPAEILVEIMAPQSPPMPQPKPHTPPKLQAKAPTPSPQASPPTPAVAQQPAPTPLAIAPSANAPAPSAAAPTTVAATTASANSNLNPNAGSTSNAPPAPAAPPKVELPSSDADYLNNPKPQYPALSKRLNEQGKVVVRALIGTDGQATQAAVKTSSGFDRLDQASVNTVLKWRYVPGKRGGVPEAMWFDVPVNWVLQ
jgi:protein TonB